MRSSRFSGFAGVLVCVFGYGLGVLGQGCAGSAAPGARIDVTSAAALMLTAAGAMAQASAVVVDKDGVPLEGATVRWTSSDPSVVEVTADGRATAQTAVGSAVLTASYGDLRAIVTAAVVTLRPETVVIETQDVVSLSEDKRTLVLRNGSHLDGVREGAVVVHADQDGFLSRVTSVTRTAGELHLTLTDAAITDAVLEMELNALSPEAQASGAEAQEPIDDGIGQQRAALTAPLSCKVESTLANVRFDAASFTEDVRLQQQVIYRVSEGTVQHFEAVFLGSVNLKAKFAAVRLRTGVKGKITCTIELKSIPLFRVPIWGPIALAGSGAPILGAKLEAEYLSNEMIFTGLTVERGEDFSIGFGYRQGEGFYPVGESTTTAESVQLGKLKELPSEEAIRGKVELFIGLKLAAGLAAGPEVVGKLDFAKVTVPGGYDFSLQTPFAHDEPDYSGPKWEAYAKLEGDIKPLLSGPTNAAAKWLERIGIEEVDDGLTAFGALVGVDAKLFSFKRRLHTSPTVTLSATPQSVETDSTVEIDVMATSHADDARAEAMLFTAGRTPRGLGTEMLTDNGTATMRWTPRQFDEGTHQVRGFVFDGIFGDVGLPYASESMATLTVRCTSALCMPDNTPPPPIPRGENPCIERVNNSGWRLVEGATYTETYSLQQTSSLVHISGAGESGSETRSGSYTRTWTCDEEGRCAWEATGGYLQIDRYSAVDGEVVVDSSRSVGPETFNGYGTPWGNHGGCTSSHGVTRQFNGVSATSSARHQSTGAWTGTTEVNTAHSFAGCTRNPTQRTNAGHYVPVDWLGCCTDDNGDERVCLLEEYR